MDSIAFTILLTLFCTFIQTIISQTCPDGVTSVLGPCVAGDCPEGYMCTWRTSSGEENCCAESAMVETTTECTPCRQLTTTAPTIAHIINDCRDKRADCFQLRSMCNIAHYYQLMTNLCAATCGRCQTSERMPDRIIYLITEQLLSNCYDRSTSCASVIQLCHSPAYFEVMSRECARTCGRCSVTAISPMSSLISIGRPTCTDVSSQCAQLAPLCNEPSYYHLMTKECALTCERCFTKLLLLR